MECFASSEHYFHSKNLFIGKSKKNTPSSPLDASKKLDDFKIKPNDPKVYVQKMPDGTYSYTFNKSGKKASKGFLNQQKNILHEKGYTPEQATDFVEKLSQSTGKHRAVIKDAVGKAPFVDSQRQAWAEWAENSLIQKGYSPEEAKTRSFNLLKEAGTRFNRVETVINYTPLTQARNDAIEAEMQYIENNVKPWATETLEKKGFTPAEARELFDNLMHQAGGSIEQVTAYVENQKPRDNVQETAEDMSQSAIENSIKEDQKNLETLGLSSDATRAEAKAAYHKLALKYHPDKSSGQEAENTFKTISTAYSALKQSATFDKNPPET
ncbi:DnaJ domain-containing protein [Endozoicomonas gorgoniicola]|uniref:DnaJ domain-containing protein n=1 Tax=Endozoicomonas gorgoniicola TaxID=1234144 RepID=A0ABT3MZD8_9GAMM|nr:J domain-containing protein [Endozoicomonas gorgoniicola]MCW7554751.1 DnaJ domain-containing protein [Endozoicomonas gorgoniicola]